MEKEEGDEKRKFSQQTGAPPSFPRVSPGAVCKGQLDGEAKCCEIVFYGLDVGNSVSTRNQEFKQASPRGKMFKLGIT